MAGEWFCGSQWFPWKPAFFFATPSVVNWEKVENYWLKQAISRKVCVSVPVSVGRCAGMAGWFGTITKDKAKKISSKMLIVYDFVSNEYTRRIIKQFEGVTGVDLAEIEMMVPYCWYLRWNCGPRTTGGYQKIHKMTFFNYSIFLKKHSHFFIVQIQTGC